MGMCSDSTKIDFSEVFLECGLSDMSVQMVSRSNNVNIENNFGETLPTIFSSHSSVYGVVLPSPFA